MTILILPSWYDNKHNSVRGSFIKDQAVALKKAGYDVIVAFSEAVTLKDLFDEQTYRISKKTEDGILTYRYNIPSFGSQGRNTYFERCTKGYRKLLKKVFAENSIDIVHAHALPPAGPVAAYLKKEFKKPLVYTEHFSGVQKGLSDYYKSGFCSVLDVADSVISVSNSLKESMIAAYGKDHEIHVIPNILSPVFSYEERKQGDSFNVITVGGLIPRKRHNLTIKAFSEAFASVDNAKLYIVGQGSQKAELEKLVSDLGEQERVIFTGLLDRESVAKKMRESDLFVLPSANETFGVVYIEAMASGLPVIGTKNGGFDEIYDEDSGFIVPVDDYTAIVTALKDAYRRRDGFDRRGISEKAISKYGEKAFIEKMSSIYNAYI